MKDFQLTKTIINKISIEKKINKVAKVGLIDKEDKQIMLDKIQDSSKRQEVLDDLEFIIKLANSLISKI